MDVKNLYLIFKSSYRFDRFVFRDVVYVGLTFSDVYGKLIDMLSIVYSSSGPDVRFDDSGKWIMMSNYHSTKFGDLNKSDMYQIFKMKVGEFESKQIDLTTEMIDNIKIKLYGRK